MDVNDRLSMTFDFALEREVMQAITQSLTPLFDCDAPRHRIALLVASSNAGALTSVKFWSEAQSVGLALASPELFPWCLANAPCGALARHFGIRGPNYTFLGGADALSSAMETAEEELTTGNVDVAIIVVLELALHPARTGELMGMRLIRSAPCTTPRTL